MMVNNGQKLATRNQALSPMQSPSSSSCSGSSSPCVERIEISAKLDTAFGLVANILATVHLRSGEQDVHRWQTLAPEGEPLADWFERDMVPEWVQMLTMEEENAQNSHGQDYLLIDGNTTQQHTSQLVTNYNNSNENNSNENNENTNNINDNNINDSSSNKHQHDDEDQQDLEEVKESATERAEQPTATHSLMSGRRAVSQIAVIGTNVSLYYDSMLDIPLWATAAPVLNITPSVGPTHITNSNTNGQSMRTRAVWASSPSSFVSEATSVWQSSLPPDSCYGDEDYRHDEYDEEASACSSSRNDQVWAFDDDEEDSRCPPNSVGADATRSSRASSCSSTHSHSSSRSRSPSIGLRTQCRPARRISSPMMRALSLPSPEAASSVRSTSSFTPKRSVVLAAAASFSLPPPYPPFAHRIRHRSASATSLIMATTTGESSASSSSSFVGSPSPTPRTLRRSPSAQVLGIKSLQSGSGIVSPESPEFWSRREGEIHGVCPSSLVLRTEALLKALCRRARRMRMKETMFKCMNVWKTFARLPSPPAHDTATSVNTEAEHVASFTTGVAEGRSRTTQSRNPHVITHSNKINTTSTSSSNSTVTSPTSQTPMPRIPRHASPPIPELVQSALKLVSPFNNINNGRVRAMSADGPQVVRYPSHAPVTSARVNFSPQSSRSSSPCQTGDVGGLGSRRQQAQASGGGGGMFHVRVGNNIIQSPKVKTKARAHRRGSSPRMPRKQHTSPFLVHNRRGGPTQGPPLAAPFRKTMALFQQGFPQDEDVLSAWRKQAVRAVHQSSDRTEP